MPYLVLYGFKKHLTGPDECCNAALEEILTLVYKRTVGTRNHPTHPLFSEEDSRKKKTKMKLFVVLALVAAACAAPQNPQDVQILRYDVNNAGLDSYSFAWELSDGSKHEEQGQLKNQGTENEALSVQGQYAWVAPDGVTYIVSYVADENGFRPQIQQGPGGSVPSGVIESLLGQ
ncbi:cuticle protein CP14.6-like isoform X1 [Trichoplusia ni]|uniref:Cuticle protein CP14.6-like isoform X1 n=1 Tax=Trichoplusia ni TaxID=7111 RepID=A0A7E5VNJ6_TRINI|nr:cuticle protein CP14.6-like isoform X1 [Trichoplusia ni]